MYTRCFPHNEVRGAMDKRTLYACLSVLTCLPYIVDCLSRWCLHPYLVIVYATAKLLHGDLYVGGEKP